ncbi:hypothetical protein ANRL4_01553 [Anaerolineae bacterium]|nr:hypothetical protein ANRL4_01553 [Anaerolineae bacterium]
MKKNIRQIPKDLLTKLRQIDQTDIVVACTVRYKATTLRKGVLKHLGVRLTPKGLFLPVSVIPSADQGKYSNINVNGEEIVRRDLPMITSYTSVETPNWGDPVYGYHSVDLPHDSYKREFRPPRETEIVIHSATTYPGLSEYLISFRLNEILRKNSKDFKKRLFENLNILQENVGACGIEAASTPLEEYSRSLHLSWEILPPGTKQEVMERLFGGREASAKAKKVAAERYDFFMTLKPQKLVYGKSGFRRYFGALIRDDLVLFENVEYGNAVYIMFDDWRELSTMSRIDLLSGKYGRSFQRVTHLKGWKGQVRSIIKHRVNK